MPRIDGHDLDTIPSLRPRVIGCTVDAASYHLLEAHSRACDLPMAELIRQALGELIGQPITAPTITIEEEE